MDKVQKNIYFYKTKCIYSGLNIIEIKINTEELIYILIYMSIFGGHVSLDKSKEYLKNVY